MYTLCTQSIAVNNVQLDVVTYFDRNQVISIDFYRLHITSTYQRQRYYSQVQNKRRRGGVYFFVIFGDLPAAYFDPPFINFSNFSKGYKEVHKYIRLLMFR